ncbi:MAG: TylF/MycF/NovP-related O-methyltransferase [Alphaproteobacteria bacterium]
MLNHLNAIFYGVKDYDEFRRLVQGVISQFKIQKGIFTGDNLLAFNRNLSFLEDAPLMKAYNKHAKQAEEQAALWRIAVNGHFAKRALTLPGDIVECACYRGTTARILCDYLDFGRSDKEMWLYDLFEHEGDMAHHSLPDHGTGLYEFVRERFSDLDNVRVIKGEVPGILAEHAPETVAHLHLDLNDVAAELGALEFFYDRVVPGGSIVLDDYGWLHYRNQKLAEDKWLAGRGVSVLELPTGQGLLIK